MRAFRGVANYGKNNKANQREASDEPTTNTENAAPDSDNLSDKQRIAISWLLQGKTLQATADICSINVRTLRRWKDEPEFTDHYAKARREQAEAFEDMVVAAATAAFETMLRHLHCGNLQAELRAAKALAQFQTKIEATALKTRIAQLESVIKQQVEQIQSLEQKFDSLCAVEPEPQSPNTDQIPAVNVPPNWISKFEGDPMLPSSNPTALTLGQTCLSAT